MTLCSLYPWSVKTLSCKQLEAWYGWCTNVCVFRECPLSLTAAEGLLALDVKVPEVNSLMIQGLQGAKLHDW